MIIRYINYRKPQNDKKGRGGAEKVVKFLDTPAL